MVEPTCLFADASGDGDHQRPDILLRSPRGFGRQIILDVAVTGLDGQSRPSEDLPNRHLQVHYNQKVAKYGHIAEQNRFQFIPAIFSHTGLKRFVMMWWSKCISMVIAKTASRNVAFKAVRLSDSIFDRQSEILMTEAVQVNSPSHEEDFDGVGCNADLYASSF